MFIPDMMLHILGFNLSYVHHKQSRRTYV